MKKFFIVILSFLYLSATFGATINMHFCMGKLVEISFFENHEDDCSKCGMEKDETAKNSCCKDESKEVKIDDDQKSTNIFLLNSMSTDSELPAQFYELQNHSFTSTQLATPKNHAPPPGKKVDIFLFNCSFLI